MKKGTFVKLTVNMILNGKNLNAFPKRDKARMSSLTTSIQHKTGCSSQCNQARDI